MCSFTYGALSDDQILYYKFDGNVSDATPAGFDATLVGATTTTGKINAAYLFDGDGDKIFYDTNSSVLQDKPFSFSAWIYWDGGTGQNYVLDWFSNRINIALCDISGSTADICFFTGASATGQAQTTSTINSNTWYHVVATSDGSTEIQLIVNAGTPDTGTPNSISPASPYSFVIGGHGSNNALSWNGKIDEVGLWGRVITASEISYLYASGTPDEDQQYPYVVALEDHSESVYQLTQGDIVAITADDVWTSILEGEISIDANFTNYGSTTIQVLSIGSSTDFECRTLINGIESGDNVARTNTAGQLGSLSLLRPNIETAGTYNISVQCIKNGGDTFIGFANSIGHVYNTSLVDSLYIEDEYYINGTNQVFGSQLINSTYDGYLIFESSANATSTITSSLLEITFTSDDGQSCGVNRRYVDINQQAAIGGVCAFEVSAGVPINISFIGNGTDISVSGSSHVKVLSYANSTPLLDVNVTDTLTLLGRVTVENPSSLSKVFMKASIPIVDSTQNVNFQFAVDGVLVGQEIPYTAGSTIKQSLQQLVADAPAKTSYNVSLYATSVGVPITSIEISGGNLLAYAAADYPLTSKFFNVTAINEWNNSPLLNFTVSDGVTNYSTTDGLLQIFTSEPILNLTFSSYNYLNREYLNHNTSNAIEGALYQSLTYINTRTKFSNVTILSANVSAEGNTIITTNGTLNLNPNLGLLTYVLNASGYTSTTDTINITTFNNITVNLYDSRTEINIVNASDSSPINIFNITLNYGSIEEFYSTTNGSAYFNLTQTLTYNLTVDAEGFYSNTFEITPNATNYQESFELIKVGNLEIRVFDSDDDLLIVQRVNYTLTDAFTQQDFNFIGGNFTTTGLVEGTQYSLVFNSADYAEASFLINYSESLAKNVFNVYMSKNAVDITFNVLETAGDIIQNANVQVSGFINGSIQIIAEKVTDGVGQVRFNLNPDEPYFFVFSKDGYITNNVDIVTFATEYTITLQKVNVVDFDGPASNVFYTYNPKNESLSADNQTFNWIISPQDGSLIDEFGIELYFNGTLLASNVLFTPTGGNINLSYDLSPYINNSVLVSYYFIKENFTRYELNVNYEVINEDSTQGSLIELRNWVKENVTERDKIVTWVLITAFISLLVYLFSDRNKDATITTALIVGSVNVWVLAFSAITTMIFVSLLIVAFLAELKALKQGGAL